MTARLRGGFALVTVLWVLALAGGASLAATLDGRLAVDAARHRIAATRGAWEGRSCLATVRADIATALRNARDDLEQRLAWRGVDRIVIERSGDPVGLCRLSATALGAGLDVNALGEADLRDALARIVGAEDARVLADAIMRFRRDAPGGRLAAREDLAAIGAAVAPRASRALDVLDIEPGAVAILHAPPRVLRVLPGMTEEGVAYLVTRRQRAPVIENLHALITGAPPVVRTALQQEFQRFSAWATLEPEAWRIDVEVVERTTGHSVRLQQVFRRMGGEVTVRRELSW